MQPRVRYGGDAITVGGQVRALAFAPGTTRLVALGNEQTLRVWDFPEKKPALSMAHPGLGSSTALGFTDKDTAIVHLGEGFARVHLAVPGGRVEPLAAAPRDPMTNIEGVRIAPGGRFAVIVKTGANYVGTQSIARVELGAGAPVTTALHPLPTRESLASLGLRDAKKPGNVHARFNAASIRSDGSVVAIGALLHAQTRVWVLFRWGADGAPEPILRLESEEVRRAYAANNHNFYANSLHLDAGHRNAVTVQGQVTRFSLEDTRTVQSMIVSGDELQGDTHVDSGSFVDGSRRFVAASRAGIGLWDTDTGELLKARRFDEPCFVLAAAASDDGTLFAGADNRGIVLHHLPDLTPAHSPSGHRNPPHILALCPRGRHVASSDGSSLKVWHLASGELAWDLPLRVFASIVFSPDGERLFADGYFLEAATGAKLAEPGISDGTAHAWSPEDGRLVHIGYAQGDVSGSVVHFYEGPEMTRVGDVVEEHLRCMPVLSANGKRAILSSETVVYAYDMEARRRLWRIEVDVVVSALSPDGTFVAMTLIGNRDVLIVDMAKAEVRWVLPTGRTSLLETLAFGAGDRIAIPLDDKGGILVLTIDRADPASARSHLELTGGHSANVCGLTFGKDGTDLVSAAEDGSVCLWKL